ncbi:MAG: NifU family protein [Alphaproteobacteria bacterium]|nr:NifU family protein [Alphaproteobacteria bacterium]NCQ66194.1 NifU family protein [Alphaproteobacteria bacterium]NCT06542.1 NifU family protein [Alphaproteobacteria bacterium]
MFIQTEETPNPLTLKYSPGRIVMEQGTLTITSTTDAWRSPLAEALFQVAGVSELFFGQDFISVTKTPEQDWDLLKPQILGSIMEYFMENDTVIVRQDKSDKTYEEEESSEIVKEIKELIEARIRPAVAQDGGDITFERFTDGVVYLKMHGACSGCPSSSVTLKNGVENMLRHYVPEVKEVKAV